MVWHHLTTPHLLVILLPFVLEGRVARAIIPRDPDAPLDMLVVPSGLSGMRALWNVALEAQDDSVVDQAIRLLNRTHEVLSSGGVQIVTLYSLNENIVTQNS